MFKFLKSSITRLAKKLSIEKKPNHDENKENDVYYPIFNAISAQAAKNSSEKTIIFVNAITNSIKNCDFKTFCFLCDNGLPDEIPLLRSLIWKINLGYLLFNPQEWEECQTRMRDEYNQMKEAFMFKLNLEKKIFEENKKRTSVISLNNNNFSNSINKIHTEEAKNNYKDKAIVCDQMENTPNNMLKRDLIQSKNNKRNSSIINFNLSLNKNNFFNTFHKDEKHENFKVNKRKYSLHENIKSGYNTDSFKRLCKNILKVYHQNNRITLKSPIIILDQVNHNWNIGSQNVDNINKNKEIESILNPESEKINNVYSDIENVIFNIQSRRSKNFGKSTNSIEVNTELNYDGSVTKSPLSNENPKSHSENNINNKNLFKPNIKNISNEPFLAESNEKDDFNSIVSNVDRELIEDIYKDMRRTHSDFQFFLKPVNKSFNQLDDEDVKNIIKRKNFCLSTLGFQTVVTEMNMIETHLDVIARILYVYSKTHQEVNYVQGMNELCSLVYYVMIQEEELKKFFSLYQNNKQGKEKLGIYDSNSDSNINIKEYLDFDDFISDRDKLSEQAFSRNLQSKDNHPFLGNQLKINQVENPHRSSISSSDFCKNNDVELKEIKPTKSDLSDFNVNFNFQKGRHTLPINSIKFMSDPSITQKFESDDDIYCKTDFRQESSDGNKERSFNSLKSDCEADTYWCFSNLMEMLKYTYMRSEDNKDRGVFSKIAAFKKVLKLCDSKIVNFLDSKKIDISMFSLRWFILLFSQDFTLPDTIRIWDILFFIEDDSDIYFKTYFFSVAILKLKYDSIKKLDYVSIIMELQNLYDIDIENLIDCYTKVYKEYNKKAKKLLK